MPARTESLAAPAPSQDGALIPFVISGPPRSGTSLLYNLFDQHPDISWLIDEGFLFEYLDDISTCAGGEELFLASARRDVDKLVDGIRDKQVLPPVEIGYYEPGRGAVAEHKVEAPWSEDAFRGALAGGKPETVGQLWLLLVRACMKGMGQAERRYACMKSPDYGKSIAPALRACDEARALVIVRSPEMALDSLKRSRDMRGEKRLTWPVFAQCLAEMNLLVERVRNAPEGRLKWIRYEDLVSHVEPVMRETAQWLDIPFVPSLLQPTIMGQAWPGISSFKATNSVETGPSERPLQALDQAERELIAAYLGPYREFFGY